MSASRLKYMFLLASAAILLSACHKQKTETDPEEEDDADYISFYVKYSPTSKVVIEDTDALLNMALPLYVSDNISNTFRNKAVSHTANGVWRSDVEWSTNTEYAFFAYVASPTPTSSITDGSAGIIAPSDELGRTVTLAQPKTYSDSESAWADYLLSYRVLRSGTNKGLVNLEFERITASVELYVVMGETMTAVTLHQAEFRNVCSRATHVISRHAASTDAVGMYDMKNQWQVTLDEDSRTAYTFNAEKSLSKYDEAAGYFTEANKVMSFLTVHQSLDSNYILYLNYTINEAGTNHDYEAEIDLSQFNPALWSRGHKIRYFVTLDSSIDLTGTVAKWETVDFIEGVLLPIT